MPFVAFISHKMVGSHFKEENALSQLPCPWEGSVLGAATEPGQLEILARCSSGMRTQEKVLRAGPERGINANEENEYLNKTFIKDRLALSITPHFCFVACAFGAAAQKPVSVFPGYI